MKLLLSTFGYCIASALIPVVNAEAYVGEVATLARGVNPWSLAAAAASGQMLGKLVFYLLGQSSLNWRWVRKKTDTPQWQARIEKWRARIGNNRWMAGAVILVSASTGFPPLAILSVVAGQLRVPVTLFLAAGLVGRFLRFASILGLVAYLT